MNHPAMSATGTAPTIVARGRRTDEPAPDRGSGGRGRLLLIGLAALLLLAMVVTQLARPRTSDIELAPDNPAPEGGRAAAQVLSEQGVDVVFVRTTAAAVAEAEAGSTLLVVDPSSLRDVQLEALADVDADIVLTALSGTHVQPLTSRISIVGYESRTNRVVDCENEDARAAESITAGGAAVVGDVEAACFTGADGAFYASWSEDDRTWHAISDGWVLSNAGLAVAGNAALVFRTLGVHDRLVWYVPDPNDTFGTPPLVEQFPLPAPAVLQLLLVGIALVIWRARRLGPVVVEPLPVVVKATETTRGRGRLYRRARAHAHAASALRAGFLARVAGRVGLPSHATPDHVVQTLARASGRPEAAIVDVLYGPPPTTDEDLMSLTQALDTLESEVQRG